MTLITKHALRPLRPLIDPLSSTGSIGLKQYDMNQEVISRVNGGNFKVRSEASNLYSSFTLYFSMLNGSD